MAPGSCSPLQCQSRTGTCKTKRANVLTPGRWTETRVQSLRLVSPQGPVPFLVDSPQQRALPKMADRDPKILTDEEAAQVWSKAAELQADAGKQVESPQREGEEPHLPSDGYALTHVREAAHEAGIAGEYVEAALVHLRAERSLAGHRKGHPLARKLLNDPPDAIVVQRVFDATPEDVFSAMQEVFPTEPFRLTLTDDVGDPLDGGALIFDLPGMKNAFERGFAFDMADAGLKQVFVSLRPKDEPTPSCEITLESPVTSEKLGGVLVVVAATLGGGVGLGGLGALGLAIGLGPVGAVVGVVLGAGLGIKGFRALYSASMRRSRKALEGLVGAVAVRAKGVW